MQEEDPKITSSITKLFQPFKINLPINTYQRFAVDGNNLIGGGSINQVSELLWKLHRFKKLNEEQTQQLIETTNRVVSGFFIQLQPPIVSKSRQQMWIVFDGLKPKFITWEGKRKHSYYWPVIADQCIRDPRKQLQNQKAKPSHFFLFFEFIISAVKNIAEGLGINVLVAPYEGDSQIIKMLDEGIIDCVVSKDYQFIHFGVPMILNLNNNNTCDVIDFKLTQPEHLGNDKLLVRWLREADKQKRLIFSVLCGSKYMSHFRALKFRQIMEVVLECSCLSDFFRIVGHKYHIDTRNIKNFFGTFEETAGKLLLLYLFQICYSFTNQQQEPLNSHGFEEYFRINRMENKEQEVHRVKKLAPEERRLQNRYQNRELDKVFRLIGEVIQKYDDDESYRKGHKKIHNDKQKSSTQPVLGETMEAKISFVFANREWIAQKWIRKAVSLPTNEEGHP